MKLKILNFLFFSKSARRMIWFWLENTSPHWVEPKKPGRGQWSLNLTFFHPVGTSAYFIGLLTFTFTCLFSSRKQASERFFQVNRTDTSLFTKAKLAIPTLASTWSLMPLSMLVRWNNFCALLISFRISELTFNRNFCSLWASTSLTTISSAVTILSNALECGLWGKDVKVIRRLD